jgi:hypothetical protein
MKTTWGRSRDVFFIGKQGFEKVRYCRQSHGTPHWLAVSVLIIIIIVMAVQPFVGPLTAFSVS